MFCAAVLTSIAAARVFRGHPQTQLEAPSPLTDKTQGKAEFSHIPFSSQEEMAKLGHLQHSPKRPFGPLIVYCLANNELQSFQLTSATHFSNVGPRDSEHSSPSSFLAYKRSYKGINSLPTPTEPSPNPPSSKSFCTPHTPFCHTCIFKTSKAF